MCRCVYILYAYVCVIPIRTCVGVCVCGRVFVGADTEFPKQPSFESENIHANR